MAVINIGDDRMVTNGGDETPYLSFMKNVEEEMMRMDKAIEVLYMRTERIRRVPQDMKEGKPDSPGYDEFSATTGDLAKLKDRISNQTDRIIDITDQIDV